MLDYPKKEKLSTILKEDKEEEEPLREYQVNPLRLNAICGKASTPANDGLMYVNIVLNNRPVCAMVDTSASHSFLSDGELTHF